MAPKPKTRIQVTEKACRNCKVLHPASQFLKSDAMVDGLGSYCRPCRAAMRRDARRRDPEASREYHRAYNARTADKRNARRRERLLTDPEYAARIRERDRSRQDAKTDALRQWRQKNPGRVAEINKRYLKNNPEKAKDMARKKYLRMRQDPKWRLQRIIRVGLWRSLAGHKGGAHWFDLLGYTPGQLKVHLERQFVKGMTWANMGEWHLDHIVPLASFDVSGPDDPTIRRAWALANLRPLWGTENMSKGSKRLTLL